jgi:hypothetical protein
MPICKNGQEKHFKKTSAKQGINGATSFESGR